MTNRVEAEPGPDEAPGTPSPPDRRARRVAALVLGLLLVFATGLQVAHVARYRKVSPIDELQHLDYLVRAPRGDLPGSGDKVLEESGRIETCARIDEGFDAKLQPCVAPGGDVDIDALQEGGYNTAFIHPPTYYFVDGVVARGIDAVVPGSQSLLTTGRLAGVVWVWAGVLALWVLLAELGAGLAVRSSVIVIIITAPTVLHAAATINPDGTSLAVGALVLWVALRWEKHRLPTWTLAAVAVLATLTKVTNLGAVGVAVAYLAWPALRSLFAGRRAWRTALGDSGVRRRLVGVALMAGGVLVPAVLWTIAQHVLQVVPPSELPMVITERATSFPTVDAIDNWHKTVSPLAWPYVPAFLASTGVLAVAKVVDLAVVVGAVAGAIVAKPLSRARRLAVTTLSIMVLLAPALVVFNYVVQGIFVWIPSRYGLSLIPALAGSAVPALKSRFGTVAVGALALVATGVVVWGLAFPLAG